VKIGRREQRRGFVARFEIDAAASSSQDARGVSVTNCSAARCKSDGTLYTVWLASSLRRLCIGAAAPTT